MTGFAASSRQRVKVMGHQCAVCGFDGKCDPAHCTPRSMGGCDHQDCVIPLCRECHNAYDTGRLDLAPYLEPRWRKEQAHAVEHLGLFGAIRRITNGLEASSLPY